MVARLIQATVLLPAAAEMVNGSYSTVYVKVQSFELLAQSLYVYVYTRVPSQVGLPVSDLSVTVVASLHWSSTVGVVGATSVALGQETVAVPGSGTSKAGMSTVYEKVHVAV